MEEELYQKVAVLENTVDKHSKLLDKQQERNDVQTELNTLTKVFIEESKETRKQLQKFSETIDRVNENLTHLNISHQQMKQDMNEIGSRVSDIEKGQEESKIDPNALFKSILSYVMTGIGSIAIALIIYLLTEGK
jgi:TolA-binding protein